MLSKAEIRTIMEALMVKEVVVENSDFPFKIITRVHFSKNSSHPTLIGKLSIMLEMAR